MVNEVKWRKKRRKRKRKLENGRQDRMIKKIRQGTRCNDRRGQIGGKDNRENKA